MLYARGIYLNACFDELNVREPNLVREIHREYIDAGAEMIETNTFGANRYKLKKYGLEDRAGEFNLAGAELARKEAGADVFVAGSIGPLGVNIEPWGQVPAEEAGRAFAGQAKALAAGGVDLFILETFADLNEIRLALSAVRSVARGLPLIAQMTIDEEGVSLYGTTPEVFTRRLEEWGADVIGLNCSVGPAAMLQCIERMAELTDKPLSAMPNAGMPRAVEGRNIYLSSPEYMAEYVKRFILHGVKVVGGCCGTTPAHIKAMSGAVRALQPPRAAPVRIAVPLREDGEKEPTRPREKSSLGRKLDEGKFVVSVEIVPPRGYDPALAVAAARTLKECGIDCVNIPDGPRASARMSPMALATIIQARAEIEPILHYTCRDRNLLGMQSDLLGIFAQNIRNILIITGDPPKMGDYPDATAVFDVDSIGLTHVVDGLNRGIDIGGKKLDMPTAFFIGVGANPGAINPEYEMKRFEAKIQAGAEFAITQPVFDLKILETFLRRIPSPRIPVLAGIWPLSSLRNAEFMNNEVPGASVPLEIMERMRKAQDRGPERAREEGIEIAREILATVKDLVQGVQISPPFGRTALALEVLGGIAASQE